MFDELTVISVGKAPSKSLLKGTESSFNLDPSISALFAILASVKFEVFPPPPIIP